MARGDKSDVRATVLTAFEQGYPHLALELLWEPSARKLGAWTATVRERKTGKTIAKGIRRDATSALQAATVTIPERFRRAGTELKHVRHGFGAVRPYVYGNLDLADFVKHAFRAVELERHELNPGGFHVEAQVGDSVLVLEIADPPPAGGAPAPIYVYVEDVDRAYERALKKKAASVAAPENKPYGERVAGVRDSFGNIWWISTYRGEAK